MYDTSETHTLNRTFIGATIIRFLLCNDTVNIVEVVLCKEVGDESVMKAWRVDKRRSGRNTWDLDGTPRALCKFERPRNQVVRLEDTGRQSSSLKKIFPNDIELSDFERGKTGNPQYSISLVLKEKKPICGCTQIRQSVLHAVVG